VLGLLEALGLDAGARCVRDGVVVGSQGVGGRDFAVLREVHTGSWLERRYQGQGIGTQMRAAVLALAFDGLEAQSAVSAVVGLICAESAWSNPAGQAKGASQTPGPLQLALKCRAEPKILDVRHAPGCR
jgi:GNAT superfamily N-acetyltransferase